MEYPDRNATKLASLDQNAFKHGPTAYKNLDPLEKNDFQRVAP
jgi:hypothetical protein